MKEKKNYYLIVPVSDIYEKKLIHNVYLINNQDTKYLFNYYDIPLNYQKVVFKIDINKNQAKELLTDSIYNLNESFIKILLKNNNQTFKMESIDNVIDTKCKLYTIKSVKTFYQSIIDKGLSRDYELAIKEIHQRQVNINNNHNLRKIKRNEYIH